MLMPTFSANFTVSVRDLLGDVRPLEAHFLNEHDECGVLV